MPLVLLAGGTMSGQRLDVPDPHKPVQVYYRDDQRRWGELYLPRAGGSVVDDETGAEIPVASYFGEIEVPRGARPLVDLRQHKKGSPKSGPRHAAAAGTPQ